MPEYIAIANELIESIDSDRGIDKILAHEKDFPKRGGFKIALPEIGVGEVTFSEDYPSDRMFTFCVIRVNKTAGLVMGIAVKHPHDRVNYRLGRSVAFDKALDALYPRLPRSVIVEYAAVSEDRAEELDSRRQEIISYRAAAWDQLRKWEGK